MSRTPSDSSSSDSSVTISSTLSSTLSSTPSTTPSPSPTPSPSLSPSQSFTFPVSDSSLPSIPTSASELSGGMWKGKDGKLRPIPQVIRVVMSEWRTQYVTLRCESHHTVDNFKQVVLNKLGKKGEVQIHMYDFNLCLDDPVFSTNKEKTAPLNGQDLVLSYFKDRTHRSVIYLVPSMSALPAVTQAIRQSFALASNSQKDRASKKESLSKIKENT